MLHIKPGLRRSAVSVRPSVCLSAYLSRSCILSKRINISSKSFHHFRFSVPNVMAIFRRGPPNWRIGLSGFCTDNCWTVKCDQLFDGGV